MLSRSLLHRVTTMMIVDHAQAPFFPGLVRSLGGLLHTLWADFNIDGHRLVCFLSGHLLRSLPKLDVELFFFFFFCNFELVGFHAL